VSECAIPGAGILRRALRWTAAALAGLVGVVLLLAAAVDAGYFRQQLIRVLTTWAGREIRVAGALEAHLLSFHPRLVAEGVTINNPGWMPPGVTAQVGKVSLVLETPGFGRGFGIDRLEMDVAMLHLVRDSTGRANWQQTDPDKGDGKGLPIIRSLSMPNARVVLDDALRHLQFEGTVSALDVKRTAGLPPLRIEGEGQLNGRAASFGIDGDPLATASHDRSYHFTFAERSSGSRLIGRGFLSRPFDFNVIDATFEAQGDDLKDLYFLTGITLVNTGNYHLAGKFARRARHSSFSELVATSGQSDVRGSVWIDSTTGRPNLVADFKSHFLRSSDLGARAAGREAEPQTGTALLLPDTRINPEAMRRGDAVVNFHARRVDLGRVPLRAVEGKLTVDHGVLTLTPLSADLLEGKLTAHVKLDATTEVPVADFDLKITDLQLGRIDHKGAGQPLLEGLLRARVAIRGRGTSIHQVAASANGTMTAVLPRGSVRASLAELAGLDLRGLGLFVTKKTQETAVRCGVASFQAHEGTLTAQSLVVDTDPVLITGDGRIHLDSEALDLVLHGHPKSLRLLRLRSPLLVRGTLSHPSIEVQARNSLAQAAAAVGLGIVLTPLASVLAFVDPGLAKDADCASLLAAVHE
jgi:uncharacterized protein involved in outer membrane biogenesis